MDADKILRYFKEELDLYHAPFLKMSFRFEEKQVKLSFFDLDELKDEYVPFDLYFNNVSGFVSEYPEDVVFNPTSCYSAECWELSSGQFKAEFIFMLDHAPLWKVSIRFSGFYTEGGLSPEAQAHRDAYFEEIARGSKDEG